MHENGRTSRLVMGVIALGMGLMMLNFSREDALSHRMIEKQGVDVLSEPLLSYTERAGFRGDKHYGLPLVFVTQKGEQVRTLQEVSYTAIRDFQPGQRFALRYLPDDPQQVVVKGEEEAGMGLTKICTVFLLGWGLWMLVGYFFAKGNPEPSA